MEAVRLHVAAPTMTTAHYLRLASAYRGQRENVHKLIDGGFQPQPLEISGKERDAFLEHLRMAVYTSCLASYIQGMNVIEAAEQENKWCIDYQAVWQIWRAGCIIQSDYISEEILKPAFDAWSARNGKPMERGDGETINLLLEKKPLDGLRTGYSSLKKVLARCTEHDFVVPAMSATLEYIKYSTSTGELEDEEVVQTDVDMLQTYQPLSTKHSSTTSAPTCTMRGEIKCLCQRRVSIISSG